MKTLHALTGGLDFWMWYTLTGLNGRYISRSPTNPWLPIAHLRRVDRGTPPEMGSVHRANWTPFMTNFRANIGNRAIQLNPLCGPIHSASRAPQAGFLPMYMRETVCPNCARRAGELGIIPMFWEEVGRNDPFANIPRGDRVWMVDPVSGL